MEYLKVKDHPNLVRDKRSKAILNTDLDALAEYKSERDKAKQMQSMLTEHSKMKDDIDDIKSLLQQLLTAVKAN